MFFLELNVQPSTNGILFATKKKKTNSVSVETHSVTPFPHPFMSQWHSKDLGLLSFPLREQLPKEGNLELAELDSSVVSPEELSESFHKTIGTFDFPNATPAQMLRVKEQLNSSRPHPVFLNQFRYTLQPDTREEEVYPFAFNMLGIAGMTDDNNFRITTKKCPENTLRVNFGTMTLTSIPDIVVWYRVNQLVLGLVWELKRHSDLFNYAQLMGTLLAQSVYEWKRQYSLNIHPQYIETFAASLCGTNFRLATINCPTEYLSSLLEGNINNSALPTVKLSRAHNLWSRRDRAITMGALVGRAKCVAGPSFLLSD